MLRDVLINQKGLSNREAEVAELVTKGLSNKEVANQLFVTEKTVKFHLTNIYKKMSLKSRAQLIVWCMPHHSFAEAPVAQSGNVNAANINTNNEGAASNQAIQNTIPSGNSTVGGLKGGNGSGFGF
jgi:DNA-binding CsgD family transcriptional regulator